LVKEVWNCTTCDKDVDERHSTLFPKHMVAYSWSYVNDPYTNVSTCVDRLYREWQAHPQLIVATDFDDTVFPYHATGHTHFEVIGALERAFKARFYIVLLTASAPHRFDEMRAFMLKHGITVHSVNENPIELPFGKHGKPYYNILLDDRAGLGQALETLKAVLDKVEAASAH
jgi:hypothetical protein